MLERGLPGRIIRVLIDWYGKLFCMVKWNGSFSSWFCVKSGVRQGGILSPFLFNIYIDSVISSVELPFLWSGCVWLHTYLLNAESINACRCGESYISTEPAFTRSVHRYDRAAVDVLCRAKMFYMVAHTHFKPHHVDTTQVFTIGERSWCRRRDFSRVKGGRCVPP